MTPGGYCYFDSNQGTGDTAGAAYSSTLRLHKVYQFNPIPDSLAPAEAAHILGAEACVWTEHVSSPERAEEVVLPRMAAMAEALWSPLALRDWADFVPRIDPQFHRYAASGYIFAKSSFSVEIELAPDTLAHLEHVILSTETPVPEIRYTLDGSMPSPSSRAFSGPFIVAASAEIRAVAFRDGAPLGPPTWKSIVFHQASFKPVQYRLPYSSKYTGGGNFCLTDGLRGSTQFTDGRWQGFLEHDLDVVVDLHDSVTVQQISGGFLENPGVYIYFPSSVTYSVSLDGNTFVPVGSTAPTFGPEKRDVARQDLRVAFPEIKARFVRIHGTNVGKVPQGFRGEGEPAWLFMDEVIVK